MKQQNIGIWKKGQGITAFMMGNIVLEYNGSPMTYMGGPSGKALQLFLILLYAGDKGMTRDGLLDMLYGSSDSENPGGNLRATIFRLRRLLEKSGLPEHDYIRTGNNVYYWDPGNLPVYIDAKEFEAAAEEALEHKDIASLKNACTLYKGEFLVQLTGERWVTKISIRYQNLYFRCLRTANEELRKKREYGELLKLCSAACELYPYEEWQIMKIDCLIAMKCYKEAMQVYDEAVSGYFEEQGLPPSEIMLKRFRVMSGQIRYTSDTLRDITESLLERERIHGPYYCSYPAFIDCYRLIARMTERIEFTSVLICFTLLDVEFRVLDGADELLKAASEQLNYAIGSSVRKGDLFTCCSPGQYLVMLNGTSPEFCRRIHQRIERKLHLWDGGRKVRLDFQVLPDYLFQLESKKS